MASPFLHSGGKHEQEADRGFNSNRSRDLWLLKKYGYPPDMALLATETVREQAEQLAEELATAA